MSDTTLIGQPAAEPVVTRARPVLCFERTAAGRQQLKSPALALSPEATQLLMLFEEPQTIDELRQIIDESWLPSALIELERRRLLKRVDPVPQPARSALPALPAQSAQPGKAMAQAISHTAAPPSAQAAQPTQTAQAADTSRSPDTQPAQSAQLTQTHTGRDLSQLDTAQAAAARLARQRAQARILFLQQIGRLSTLMVERIEACQSEAELQRLTPAFIDLLATPHPTSSRRVSMN
ncbi:MAG: hypothetical protein Q4D91_12220 [Lautropia sp.]|nr:hypothetical protein [Lautropia sp.]